MTTHTIQELIARWDSNEGKPYKGQLVDDNWAEYPPGDLSCMCAQGQVLNVVGGLTRNELSHMLQGIADNKVAKLLNISQNHSILLRYINDTIEGAPSIVLTDPEKILGAHWAKILDFWYYADNMTMSEINRIDITYMRLGGEISYSNMAKEYGGFFLADIFGSVVVRHATFEIEANDYFKAHNTPFSILPLFGFGCLEEIPPRPAEYSNGICPTTQTLL